MKKIILFLFIVPALISSCAKDKGTPQPVKPPVVTGAYFSKVKIIVQTNCTVSCHAPSHGFMDGLPVILESDSDIVNKGPSIMSAIAGPFSIVNKQMPPAGGLSASDIDIVSQWLAKGGRTSDCGLNQ